MNQERGDKITSPKVASRADSQFDRSLTLESERTFHDVYAKDVDLAGTAYEALAIEQSMLRRVRMDDTRWESVELRDMVLDGCSAANAVWSELICNRLQFINARLTGIDCTNSSWQNVAFSRCKCDLAVLRYSTFKHCRFESCDLRGTDFQGADLRGVVFSNCDLRGAEMSQALLESADLRGSEVEGISMAAHDARGMKVEPIQAVHFAHLLGIRLEPRSEDRDSG